jgi:hypothetical protein
VAQILAVLKKESPLDGFVILLTTVTVARHVRALENEQATERRIVTVDDRNLTEHWIVSNSLSKEGSDTSLSLMTRPC